MSNSNEQIMDNVKNFSDFDKCTQALLSESVKAREHAYVPYSNFKVGAALLCDDGVVVTGCNVENASYSMTICAERTAIVKAVSEGRTKFSCVSVCAFLENKFCSPCGACRQVLNEFADVDGMTVYLIDPQTHRVLTTTLQNLLPLSFKF